MYDAGHTVVGVEIAEQALKDFFIENKIEYTVEKLDKINGDLYKVIQRKIVDKILNYDTSCKRSIVTECYGQYEHFLVLIIQHLVTHFRVLMEE